jgi:hypothetical protein
MRKAIFLFASMTLVALFASGVALAYGGGNFNTVRCKGGECKGTSGWDRMIGTDRRDIEYAFKGIDDLYGRGGRDVPGERITLQAGMATTSWPVAIRPMI